MLSMTLPRKFLVPTDFGEPSDKALAYAMELATKLGGEVVILHTFDLPIIGFPDGALVASPEMSTRISTAAQEGLQKTMSQYANAAIPVSSMLKQGEPWQTIIDTAKEIGAGMIVMGTHGRTGLGRALLGSVAEKVVRTSTVPVLTIHPHDTVETAAA